MKHFYLFSIFLFSFAALTFTSSCAEDATLCKIVGNCDDEDDGGGSATTVSFETDVAPLFTTEIGSNTRTCLTCHSRDTSDNSAGSGDFTISEDGSTIAYANLADYVNTSDPENSILYKKLSLTEDELTTDGLGGKQMPRNGPEYYSTEDLETILTWITEGAQDN